MRVLPDTHHVYCDHLVGRDGINRSQVAALGHFYYIYRMDYTKLHTQIENTRQWCIKHRTGIITATQKHEPGRDNPDRSIPICFIPVIDYIGHIG